jgi:hypothetical protein
VVAAADEPAPPMLRVAPMLMPLPKLIPRPKLMPPACEVGDADGAV